MQWQNNPHAFPMFDKSMKCATCVYWFILNKDEFEKMTPYTKGFCQRHCPIVDKSPPGCKFPLTYACISCGDWWKNAERFNSIDDARQFIIERGLDKW